MLNGLLLIDKEIGPTSHDIIYKIRRLYNLKKVGHLGTLDPLASGLLIVALGNATRSAQHLVKSNKEYLFTAKFGFTSETDDSEKEISTNKPLPNDIVEKIEQTLPEFRGEILQEPPRYSAIKQNGVPLYKLARKGQNITLKPRTVFIEELKITDISLPRISFLMRCSSGTYVRSVCRDLGEKLGCGAVAESIRRTASGIFSVDNAITINSLANLSEFEKTKRIICEDSYKKLSD